MERDALERLFSSTVTSIESIASQLAKFAADRDWEQFHTVKSLLLAVVGEIGELAAELQWLTDEEILKRKTDKAIANEIADVAIYLIRLSDVLEIDLGKAIEQKIQENALKYPIQKSRGNAVKYDKLT